MKNTTNPKPLVTVIIATFNSATMLPRLFAALEKQSLPPNEIEILIVDGGSTDDTCALALRHGARVINNPKTEPVHAKFMAFWEARGSYAVYLDHDEVLLSPQSLKMKIDLMRDVPDLHAVTASGYVNPVGYPFINKYINEFGEPFSFFIYGLSKDADYFVATMKKRYPLVTESPKGVVFDFTGVDELPLIELCAAGCMIDLDFFRREFADEMKSPSRIPHLFYILQTKSKRLGCAVQDPVAHYSSETLQRYLAKIKWRVKNNIHHVSSMAEAGFLGRARYSKGAASVRSWLFIPYSLSIVFPFVDSIRLAVTRRNGFYLLHTALCLYTSWLIIYHVGLKILGHRPRLRSYDETKLIG